MFILLLLFTSLLSLCKSQSVSEYPTWPVTCSFSRHDDKYPRVEPYHTSTSKSTQDECEAACDEDPHCGMYQVFRWGGLCKKYQMTEKMWGELGLNVADLWVSYTHRMSGSKLCKGETLPTNCKEYKYTEGKGAPITGFITLVQARSLTAAYCKDLCSLYSECKSVLYYRYNANSFNKCAMYKTSLSDGVEECDSTGYLECGTYECITQ